MSEPTGTRGRTSVTSGSDADEPRSGGSSRNWATSGSSSSWNQLTPVSPEQNIGMQHPFPVTSVPVQQNFGRVYPYSVIVDPFKPRAALRDTISRITGVNQEKQKEEVEEEVDFEYPASFPRMRTLGLCRRHIGSPSGNVSEGQTEEILRDKRKFSAPRQTPVKKQKPEEIPICKVQSDSYKGIELHGWEDFEEPLSDEDLLAFDFDEVRQLKFESGREEQVEGSRLRGNTVVRNQLEAGRFMGPTIASNRLKDHFQAEQPHFTPPSTSKNPIGAGIVWGDADPNQGEFILASGHRVQASAEAKARVAAMFDQEEDLEALLDFPFET